MREADDVGAALPQSHLEAEPLRVVHERAEALVSVAVVAHEDGKLPSGPKHRRAVADDCGVAVEERGQGRRVAEVARVARIALLPPVRRMQPDELEAANSLKRLRIACV